MANKITTDAFRVTLRGAVTNPCFLARSTLVDGMSFLAQSARGRLLDFGCGSKPYRNFFEVDEYIGIETHNSGHDHNSTKADVFYDGNKLPFADSSFDCVFSSQVLEHVPNIDESMSEIDRVLKPNGSLLISMPFIWEEHEVPFDFRRFTSFGIKKFLESKNFSVIEVKKSGHSIMVPGQLLAMYLFKFIKDWRGVKYKLGCILLLFPINVIFFFAAKIFPQSEHLFFDVVVVAKKRS